MTKLPLALLVGVLVCAPVAAAHADPLGKVYVCKYVGTPGENETLQTGQNPIEVSINAIPDYLGVGSYFADAQGRSYVLATVPQQPEPSADDCPGGDPSPSPTPTPSPDPSPTPTPTQTPGPTHTPNPPSPKPTKFHAPKNLAYTGSDVTGAAVSLGVLVALALGLLWLGRRRSNG